MFSTTCGWVCMMSAMRIFRKVLSTSVERLTAREPRAMGMAVRISREVSTRAGAGRGEYRSIRAVIPSPFRLW